MATKPVVVRTGAKAPVSGQYHPSGAPANREITLTRGERVPPNNQGVRQTFRLVDKTRVKNR